MKPEPENGSTEDSHDENPHYGPLPPPPRMYVPGNSPDDVFDLALNGNSLLASSTLRHVGRVSKRAALATKKQIWDSNDASIVAAQSAVDQWEQGMWTIFRECIELFTESQLTLFAFRFKGTMH